MHFRPDHHRFVELNICIYQSCQTRTWTDAEHVDVSWQLKLHVHVPSFRPLLSLPHNYISLSLLSLTLRHCIADTAKVTYSHEYMHKILQSICHFSRSFLYDKTRTSHGVLSLDYSENAATVRTHGLHYIECSRFCYT